MRLQDLPPRARRQVTAAIAGDQVSAAGRQVGPARSRQSQPPMRTAAAGPPRHSHQCATCGHGGSYPSVERHVDREHSHGRIALVLP